MGARLFTALLLLIAGCGGIHHMLKKGNAFLADGHPAAAARVYSEALDKRPDNAEALLGLARARLALGEPAMAVSPARKAVDAGAPGAKVVLARALLATGRGEEALGLLDPSSSDPVVATVRAEAMLESGDLTGAARTAIASSPGPDVVALSVDQIHLLALAAWTEARLGHLESAAKLAQRAAAATDTDPQVKAEAAAALRLAGHTEQAADAARATRSLLIEGPGPWLAAVSRLQKAGNREGALRRLSWVRACWPDDGTVARQLGLLWLDRGVLPLAISELQASLDLPPYRRTPTRSAVRYANPAAASEPRAQLRAEVMATWDALAQAWQATGDLTHAAQARQQVASIASPPDPEAWQAAAKTWEAAGDLNQAIAAMNQAVELAPRSVALRMGLAQLYAKAGNRDLAIGHARIAWNLSPGDPAVALFLGQLYIARGDRSAAGDLYRAALQAHPGDRSLRAAVRMASMSSN